MNFLKIKLLVVAIVMFAANSAFASLTYDLSVDTSSLYGQSGYVDLQFNPNNGPIVAGSAVISNFNADATLGAIQLSGGATGALPSVTIRNTNGYNDYFQAITFGNKLNLSLSLSNTAGSSFYLAFLDSALANALFSKDTVNGYATVIDVNSNGAAVTNFSDQVAVTPTPIPAAFLLFGSGLVGLVGVKKKKQI